MRILIEPSTYHCLNSGDLAMMLVAEQRIREVCPAASVHILTSAPELLRHFFPNAIPVSAESRRAWLDARAILGRCRRRLPDWLFRRLRSLEDTLWTAVPRFCSFAVGLKQRVKGQTRSAPSRFIAEIRSSELVLVTGMGCFNDAFSDSALAILDVLAIAMRYGIPVALLGQGVGPIEDPELLHRAGEVLPRVSFIGLREGKTALPLLASLGVSPSRVEVTGDDALELAYSGRSGTLGRGIGVNIRVATYSQVSQELIPRIRTVLERVAAAVGAPLVPIPVSSHPGESDGGTLMQMAAEAPGLWKGNFQLEHPSRLVEQAGLCRVVVAGSYHAAVFALAQGIPAVCIEGSPYYSQKFGGLQAQFGPGCEVVSMAEPDFDRRLEGTIRLSWDSAEGLREPLLQAAAVQIEQGRAAYSRLFENVGASGDKLKSLNASRPKRPHTISRVS